MTTIREPLEADIPELAAITLASWREAYRELLPQDFLDGMQLEDRVRGWRSNLASAGFCSFLCETRGQLAGYVNLRFDSQVSLPAELTAIYVHPRDWRRGIGARLMDRARDEVSGRGIPGLYLWALEGNERAAQFYLASGFTADGQRRDDRSFGGQRVSEVRFSLALA